MGAGSDEDSRKNKILDMNFISIKTHEIEIWQLLYFQVRESPAHLLEDSGLICFAVFLEECRSGRSMGLFEGPFLLSGTTLQLLTGDSLNLQYYNFLVSGAYQKALLTIETAQVWIMAGGGPQPKMREVLRL